MAVEKFLSYTDVLFRDGGGSEVNECLDIALKLPEMIVALLPDALCLHRSNLASLRCQHRNFCRRCGSLCTDALRVIDAVETICRSCTPERKERITEEIETRLHEGIQFFDGASVDVFPYTIDFQEETGMRLDALLGLVTRFFAECNALLAETNEAIDVAERGQTSSKMWKGLIGLASVGVAIGGFFTGHPKTGLVFGGALYAVGGELKYQEEEFKRMKVKMDNLNKELDKLHKAVKGIESDIHCHELQTEMNIMRRPRPSLLSVKLSVTEMFKYWKPEIEFSAQKEQVNAFLRDLN